MTSAATTPAVRSHGPPECACPTAIGSDAESSTKLATESDQVFAGTTDEKKGYFVSPVLLRARGLCFQWQRPALFTDLDLDVPSGVTWVQGGEGRGKTTLLRLLAAELPAQPIQS